MGPATASPHILRAMQKTLIVLAVLYCSLAAAESLQDGGEFDYIVVGGGAAGEIVASRLSENPNITVALLEAGEESDLNMKPNQFPKVSQGGNRYGFSTYQDDFSAQYIQDENVRVIAEEFTGGATPWVHMLHLRGHPNDYQGWADAAGDNSWNYENLSRYFIRSEQVKDQRTLDSSVTGYGTEGTLNLSRESSDANNKIIQAFEELGYEYHLNLTATLGITEPFYYMSEGQFQSIYQSYIVPAKNRSNLLIYPKTTATLIRFDDDQTATGVQAYNAEDTYVEVRARQEIILASGVIRTPQLMLLSGIGPAADLNDWNISLVSDLPVGEGMSDRVGAVIAFKLKESNDSTQTTNGYIPPTTVAFKALDSSKDTPDYQATNHIFPRNSESLSKLCIESYQYKTDICEKLQEVNSEHELMFSIVSITRPQSTGFMALNSLNMFDDPFIYMGYFAETADLENLAASLGDFSNIVNTENFGRLGAGLVDFELAECGSLQQNSQDYWKCYGQYMSTTTWNVVGTAQMGDVLDSKLNVRGVQKLRVVDSSAIPFAHSGYLLPSIIVMAEKAAALILDNVKISNLVIGVSEENYSASEEGLSVSEDSSLASEGNASAQGSNNTVKNEDSSRSENETVPTSENESTTLSEDEEGASVSEESSSTSDETVSAQGSNDSNTESSSESQENASAQEKKEGSPSSVNEAALSSDNEQDSSESDENGSAQRSNDLDEESYSDSKGNVSTQEINNSNKNDDSPQSENEEVPSLEDEAAPLSEDEDGASASKKSSSVAEENASPRRANDSTEPALGAKEAVLSGSESEFQSQDDEIFQTINKATSENETTSLSLSGDSTLNLLKIRAAGHLLRSIGKSAANEVAKSLESDLAANLASAIVTNSTLEVDQETKNQLIAVFKALLLEGSDSESVNETVSTGDLFEITNETEANSTLNALNIRAAARLLRSLRRLRRLLRSLRRITADEVDESLDSDEAASMASEIVANSTLHVDEETKSQLITILKANLLVRFGSEGRLFEIANETEANSTLNALNIRAIARLLRTLHRFTANEVDESLDSDKAASLASEIVTNSTLDVDEEIESQLEAVLKANLIRRFGSELETGTVLTGGLFEITNETEANSTLNALNIRAAARLLRSLRRLRRLLRSLRRITADEVDESLDSDEAASMASEIVANSTLDVDEETKSQLITILKANLLVRFGSEGRLFEIANETEANSTLNALNIRAVARLLRTLHRFTANEVDESLDSDEAASLASEIVTNSTLDVDEEIDSQLEAVLKANLIRRFGSELETGTVSTGGLFEITNETEANSTLDALNIRAAARLLRSLRRLRRLLRSLRRFTADKVDESLDSDEAASRFGSELKIGTGSTGGLFEIANEIEANSTLNAFNIRALARLFRFVGKFAANDVDESIESDEADSLASEFVTYSTLDIDDEAKSLLLAVLAAHLLDGSDSEPKNKNEAVSGRSGSEGEGSKHDVLYQIAENEKKKTSQTQANSTLDALKNGAVAWLLGSVGSSSSDTEESSFGSELANLKDNEESKSDLSAIVAVHLLGESESTTSAISGLFGGSESENEASNSWFGSDSESDDFWIWKQ